MTKPSKNPPKISIGECTPAAMRASPIMSAKNINQYPAFLLCPSEALAKEDEKNIENARAMKNVACPEGKP